MPETFKQAIYLAFAQKSNSSGVVFPNDLVKCLTWVIRSKSSGQLGGIIIGKL